MCVQSLLDRKSEDLRGVEEELGKARAERDWNHARLADANKARHNTPPHEALLHGVEPGSGTALWDLRKPGM
jgi:hypothetical protein